MLEYSKTILDKVSFNPFLFKKELEKSYDYLSEMEKEELKKWCSEKSQSLTQGSERSFHYLQNY